jgi:hypothetical protein
VPELKDLRNKCEQAPRYGVNGRYLILQAAKAPQDPQREITPSGMGHADAAQRWYQPRTIKLAKMCHPNRQKHGQGTPNNVLCTAVRCALRCVVVGQRRTGTGHALL